MSMKEAELGSTLEAARQEAEDLKSKLKQAWSAVNDRERQVADLTANLDALKGSAQRSSLALEAEICNLKEVAAAQSRSSAARVAGLQEELESVAASGKDTAKTLQVIREPCDRGRMSVGAPSLLCCCSAFPRILFKLILMGVAFRCR